MVVWLKRTHRKQAFDYIVFHTAINHIISIKYYISALNHSLQHQQYITVLWQRIFFYFSWVIQPLEFHFKYCVIHLLVALNNILRVLVIVLLGDTNLTCDDKIYCIVSVILSGQGYRRRYDSYFRMFSVKKRRKGNYLDTKTSDISWCSKRELWAHVILTAFAAKNSIDYTVDRSSM